MWLLKMKSSGLWEISVSWKSLITPEDKVMELISLTAIVMAQINSRYSSSHIPWLNKYIQEDSTRDFWLLKSQLLIPQPIPKEARVPQLALWERLFREYWTVHRFGGKKQMPRLKQWQVEGPLLTILPSPALSHSDFPHPNFAQASTPWP